MRRIFAFAAVLAFLLGIPAACSADGYRFDPAPIASMLIDALSSLHSGSYEKAAEIANEALSVNATEYLGYLHEDVWSMLREVSEIASVASSERGNASIATFYRFYRLRLQLQQELPSYAEELVGMIQDSATRDYYSARLSALISGMSSTFDAIQSMLTRGVQAPNAIEFSASLPSSADAGSSLKVELMFKDETYVDNISVSLLCCGFSERSLFLVGRNASSYAFSIDVPGTERGYFTSEVSTASLYIAVSGEVGGSPGYGLIYRTINITAEKPPLRFYAPQSIEAGGYLNLSIESEADEELYSRILVESQDRSTIFLDETLAVDPGINVYDLDAKGIPSGAYIVIFSVEPRGKYLAASFQSNLTVMGKELEASVGAPRLSLSLSSEIPLYLVLPEDPGNYTVVVREGGGKVLYVGNMSSGIRSIALKLGFFSLVAEKNLTVEIIPQNGTYDEKQASVQVFAINPVLIAAIAALFLALSSASERSLSMSSAKLQLFLERLAGKERKEIPQSVRLYRRLVRILSAHSLPPLPSETLREFGERAAKALGGSAEKLKAFLFAYERFLYSKKKPSEEELRDSYREAEEELR